MGLEMSLKREGRHPGPPINGDVHFTIDGLGDRIVSTTATGYDLVEEHPHLDLQLRRGCRLLQQANLEICTIHVATTGTLLQW